MQNRDLQTHEYFAGVAVMVINRDDETLQLIMNDGSVVTSPTVSPSFNSNSSIVESRFVPSTNLLYTKTSRGDIIETELPTLLHRVPSGKRPIIYLDQRDWSLLAKIVSDPKNVKESENVDAAKQLISMVHDHKIILPMSMSHLGETSWWKDDQRRYSLALTLTQLSRGWQMRYPIEVWKYELHQAFSNRFREMALPSLDVFTLDGCAAEHRDNSQKTATPPSEWPEGVEYTRRAMVCMMSYIDAALTTDPSPRNPITEWVDRNQFITDELAKVRRPSAIPEIMRVLLLDEIGLPTIAKVASKYQCDEQQLTDWVKQHLFPDLRSMNSFGLWSDIFQVRHLDASTKWKANDLLDMLFLTCAAGYADYVLGERAATSYISQAAKRLGRSVKVYSKMSDLVDNLHLRFQ